MAIASPAAAQQPLSASMPVAYDFTTFDGSGFDNPPAAGQLDSNEWIAIVSSGSALTFGEMTVGSGGPFAIGADDGGTSAGGVYAFDVDAIPVTTTHDYALGAQATGSSFSPGSFQLRVQNATGNTLNVITLAFELHVFNDADRSSRMTVRVIREADGAELTVDSLQRDTPEAGDVVGLWSSTPLTATIDIGTIAIAAGDNLIVSFDFDDNPDSSATGSRDEVAIDDVALSIPTCGDYTVSGAEVCDDGNIVDETACPYGMATCMACNSTCTAEQSLTGAVCGDGNIDTDDGEVCDDGNTATETECEYGTMTCTGCSDDCTTEPSLTGPYCGDTMVNGTEACDDGNSVTETECIYGIMTCMACQDDCSMENTLSGRYCGDGAIDTDDGEECDDTNTDDGDGCSSTCTTEAMADGGTMMADGGTEPDAGVMSDAGTMADGGSVVVDAGEPDAGAMVDAGVAMDAGGEVDAGANDAAAPEDASTSDSDAGVETDGGTTIEARGCGCTVPGHGHGPAPLAILAALGLGAVLVRRRRR